MSSVEDRTFGRTKAPKGSYVSVAWTGLLNHEPDQWAASADRPNAAGVQVPLVWRSSWREQPNLPRRNQPRPQGQPSIQAVMTAIPSQTIAEGGSFTAITLDDYVTDATYTPADMVWTYTGNTNLTVSIVNRVATIGIPNAHWNGAETITFRATPPDSLGDEKAATFTVTPVNDAPTDINLTNSVIAENSAINTLVGDFSTVDPDVGDTFTYSLVSGTGSTDNASFNIAGASLRTSAVFDFETRSSYSIRVRSTDLGGLFVEKVFLITIADVNEAPLDVGLSNSSVAENAAINSVVGTLSTVDPDSNNTFTYSLASGAGSTDNASFNIAGASLRTSVTFNFATKNSYSILVRSTDQGGLSVDKQFTITITFVDTVKPIVDWVSPVGDGQGYYLTNTKYINLSVTASDNVGVAEVKFYRWDKELLRYVDLGIVSNAPYQWNLDTTILYYGWNEIDVKSYDTAGNVSDNKYIFLLRKSTLYLPLASK